LPAPQALGKRGEVLLLVAFAQQLERTTDDRMQEYGILPRFSRQLALRAEQQQIVRSGIQCIRIVVLKTEVGRRTKSRLAIEQVGIP
jgi:hypothetical protein